MKNIIETLKANNINLMKDLEIFTRMGEYSRPSDISVMIEQNQKLIEELESKKSKQAIINISIGSLIDKVEVKQHSAAGNNEVDTSKLQKALVDAIVKSFKNVSEVPFPKVQSNCCNSCGCQIECSEASFYQHPSRAARIEYYFRDLRFGQNLASSGWLSRPYKRDEATQKPNF